jgi:hypothetical protein
VLELPTRFESTPTGLGEKRGTRGAWSVTFR